MAEYQDLLRVKVLSALDRNELSKEFADWLMEVSDGLTGAAGPTGPTGAQGDKGGLRYNFSTNFTVTSVTNVDFLVEIITLFAPLYSISNIFFFVAKLHF